MNFRSAASLLLPLFLILAWATPASAGQVWIETTYFVPGYKADLKVPVPDASWKVYAKKRILMGKEANGVEYLEGTDQGAVSWVVGNMVVSIRKSGEVSMYPKTSGEANLWEGDSADFAWTKKLEPMKKEKHDGQDFLIYDSGNGYKRAWIIADANRPLALKEGKFVTLYQEEPNPGEIKPPDTVVKALKERKRSEKKLGEIGAMPQ